MDSSFRAELEQLIMQRSARAEGEELRFLCPAHDDHHPSARWHREKHVWHCDSCGAGGGAFDLARRLGLEPPEASATELTLATLAEYVGLPTAFLRQCGVHEGVSGIQRTTCVDIPYADLHGEQVAVRKRLRLAGEPRMVWRRGDRVLPYGLPRLAQARSAGRVLLVEGESDSWVCWYAGIPALGMPGASTWKEAWRAFLHDIPEIFVWREPDGGGDTLLSQVAADLPDVRIVEAPPGIKDACALWHATGHDRDLFSSRIQALLHSARPASQLRTEALTREARELSESCRGLLVSPALLDTIKAAIVAAGYAGDATPPLAAYIALTSRLLSRPLNLAFVAPSGAGKNKAVEAALPLFPPEAFFLEKAGSARALVYSPESFEHRTVIVAEADSIPQDDGPAASAIRSLAEDGYMTYDVVEKDPVTGAFQTRRITKQGPTGLITTSTRPLREQLSTRVLTFTISDTPEQTRKILEAHAQAVNRAAPQPDLSRLVDLQRWLSLAADHKVSIPFAQALANLVPVGHVRMRRDFRQLLTAIQAVALLYQRQRGRDARGRIIATFDDYRMAREIVLDAFTTAALDGVTDAVRETVTAVADLYTANATPVTKTQVAGALHLSLAAAWYRVQRAIGLGYVVNDESRPRQPAKLLPGDPLPKQRVALPTLDELSVAFSGQVCARPAEKGRNVETARGHDDAPGFGADVSDDASPEGETVIEPGGPPRRDSDPGRGDTAFQGFRQAGEATAHMSRPSADADETDDAYAAATEHPTRSGANDEARAAADSPAGLRADISALRYCAQPGCLQMVRSASPLCALHQPRKNP